MANKNIIDVVLTELDYAISTIYNNNNISDLKVSAKTTNKKLDINKAKQSERVMRINHMGEVCAQGLYRGQAVFTSDDKVRGKLYEICDEENYHLKLCNQRLRELDGKKSILNPLWYLSSFVLGSIAGINDKKWKLGFIEETEKQVEGHLTASIKQLPKEDLRSKEILQIIAKDEKRHRNTAKKIGSEDLPTKAKKSMHLLSTIMKKITYYV
jgi:ubiquinone biosynthesis monooxygenase Coq7